jgi:hypothetical protein
MMTRKHFKALAETLLKISDLTTRKTVANEAAEMFQKENPRFNKAKFMAACGLN